MKFKNRTFRDRPYRSESHPHKDIGEILAESEERVRQFLEELESSRYVSYCPVSDKSLKQIKTGA